MIRIKDGKTNFKNLLRLAILASLGHGAAPFLLGHAVAQEPRHVLGDGLSQGYFLPPSVRLPSPPTQLPNHDGIAASVTPLSPTAIAPQLSAPTTNNPLDIEPKANSGELIIGSGVAIQDPPKPSYIAPPSQLPTNSPSLPLSQSQPLFPQPSPSISTPSVELDLRSNHNQPAKTKSFEVPSCAPLSTPTPWFFSSNGLLLQRRDSAPRLFSSDILNSNSSSLSSRDVDFGTAGGFELSGGRYFQSGKFALMGTYWGLFSDPQSASLAAGPSSLQTHLPFNVPSSTSPGIIEGLELNGTSVTDLFANASVHSLVRDQDFQNMEINLFWFAIGGSARQPFAPDCTDSQCWNISKQPTGSNAPWFQVPSRLRVSLFSGVRWFQYRDALTYSAQDLRYDLQAQNDLWGVQSGAIAHWLASPRWGFWSSLNAGVYNNHLQSDSRIGDNNTLATIISSSSSTGQGYQYSSADNSSAFLGETATGLAWHFARGWTFNASYRILGASQVGTTLGQIPSDFRFHEAATPKNDDSLILHGVSLGASYNF